jgi:hypothetical protein
MGESLVFGMIQGVVLISGMISVSLRIVIKLQHLVASWEMVMERESRCE